jgi:hypothetical protein
MSSFEIVYNSLVNKKAKLDSIEWNSSSRLNNKFLIVQTSTKIKIISMILVLGELIFYELVV